MDDLERCVVGRWIHSYEDDTSETRAYRGPEYKFPPARGRQGFELRPDGDAVLSGIAPADGSQQVTARWTLADRRITITALEGSRPAVTFDVVSCDDGFLRVTR
jgi:hypothetical protein